jgi:hypothetical protein
MQHYHKTNVPLEVGTYSSVDIEQANRRHDQSYGWSFQNTHAYSNLARFPETVTGDFYEACDRQREREKAQSYEPKNNGANLFP